MNATETKAWVKSEDCGYAPGKLLLDGDGGHWSVYRSGRQWIAAWVENGICRRSQTFTSRKPRRPRENPINNWVSRCEAK